MANETDVIKIPDDIEYRVIGNAFCLLVASGGLLAGTMMAERSLEYWREDLVPLLLVFFFGFRLFRTLVNTMTLYQGGVARSAVPVSRENIQRMHATVAQLPQNASYTPEQVVDEVVRRIEAQKAEAARRAQQ